MNRDNDGFGFTLADASPVNVTGTTENGSAARAGIIVGDKIIKVCYCSHFNYIYVHTYIACNFVV